MKKVIRVYGGPKYKKLYLAERERNGILNRSVAIESNRHEKPVSIGTKMLR